jgi:hypothetical protein
MMLRYASHQQLEVSNLELAKLVSISDLLVSTTEGSL